MRLLSGRTLFVLLATVLAKPALARTSHYTAQLPEGARVQLMVLSDGYTVGLSIEGVDARALTQALVPWHAASVRMLRVGPQDTVAYVRMPHAVVSAKASLGKPKKAAAQKKKRRAFVEVRFTLEMDEPRKLVLNHVLRTPLPLPVSLAHHQLMDADKKFVAKQLGEAELLLAQMARTKILPAWVAVRMGDLAVYKDEVERACEYYREAQTSVDTRVPSQLAAHRANVLGCSKAPEVPWATLLARVGRDDFVGRRMASEAQWALRYTHDANILMPIVKASAAGAGEQLAKPLRAALAARLVRDQSDFARVAQGPALVAAGPPKESFDLALDLMASACALDLVDGVQPPAAGAHSWLTLTAKRRTAMLEAAKSCALLGPMHAPLALGDAPAGKLRARFGALEKRVAAVQAEAAARASRGVNVLRPPANEPPTKEAKP